MASPAFVVAVQIRSTSREARVVMPHRATCMAKSSKSRSGKKGPGKRARAAVPETSPDSTRDMSTEGTAPNDERELLRKDLEAFKARAKKPSSESAGVPAGAYAIAKDALDKVLVFDFFLVVGLLGWLLVALVPHFVAKNDVLLDPWLALWQPFIQPVLGILMLGTLTAGMISYMFDKPA